MEGPGASAPSRYRGALSNMEVWRLPHTIFKLWHSNLYILVHFYSYQALSTGCFLSVFVGATQKFLIGFVQITHVAFMVCGEVWFKPFPNPPVATLQIAEKSYAQADCNMFDAD